MAIYRNPIGSPNPFFTDFPEVLVVRHVRVIPGTGEVVAEDPNQMPRHIRRIAGKLTYSQELVHGPRPRNIPANNTRKVAW